MFKSLSSRSTRSASVSSTNTFASASTSHSTTPTPSAFIPTVLPPIPPTPTRETPAICVVAPTPGGPTSSPLLEKRRTRTLVPRRAVLGKENASDETPRAGSLRARPLRPAPVFQAPADPTTLVAQQFVATHQERQRQFHSVGPSSGISFVPAPRNPSPPSRQGSLRTKPSKVNKRVLVESRAYPNGGEVEVVKETIGRSSKPLSRIGSEVLGSIRGGTITGGSTRLARTGSTRIIGAESVRESMGDENAGTAVVIKKKKSRGTLDSIRWALGDRTNAARKAEKEKEKAEKAVEKERRSQDSGSEPLKAKLTIDTRVPRVPVDETPTTSTILSAVVDTPATSVANSTDNEGVSASNGEKGKWRWTIGRKRAKSPGPSLSSTFDRPGHSRAISLDVDALMAASHPEESENELASYARNSCRAASLDLPTLLSSVAETQAEGQRPPSLPVETAPVDFGDEPKTIRKSSTGSAESQTSSGTTRRSSIAQILGSSGENASNTGSLALRAMRSVRSIARLGGWGKGEDSDKAEKEITIKDKKKKYRKKLPIMEDEPPRTSGEGEPTTKIIAPIGQPIRPKLKLKSSRADLGVCREDGTSEGREQVAGTRLSSGSSSVAPSTLSYGKTAQSRMSHGSSGSSEYAASSTHSRAPSMRISPKHSAPIDDGGLFSTGTSVRMNTAKKVQAPERDQDASNRGRQGLMSLFEIPPPQPSPPHVEVRGVKIDKGRVRDRVKEFEARAEEHAAASQFGTMRYGSIARRAPTIGHAAASSVNNRRDSYIEEREYSLSMGRCVSVPLLSSESPNRPIQPRPLSEQMLRSRPQSIEDAAAISVLNAANLDLSDLINRLDLSATPDSKYALSPDASRRPGALVEESPCKPGLHGRREPKASLTSLKGYNHPSLQSASTLAHHLMSGEDDVEFDPPEGNTTFGSVLSFGSAVGSRPVRPRPRASLGSGGTAPKLSVASSLGTVCEHSRIAPEARHRAGMRGTLGDDSMLAVEEGDGPNSDIPDELQIILAGQSEDEGALPSPDLLSPSLPTHDAGRNHSRVHFDAQAEYSDDAEGGGSEGEEVSSRKSFDFTGELGQLKGGSRNSFVEALVTAFKTPPIPSANEGQLQLNIDSLDEVPHGIQHDHIGEDIAPHELVEAYDSGRRTPTFAQISQPANKKSSGQLNLEFTFAVSQPSPENRVADTSATTDLADSTFAQALANLSQARPNAHQARTLEPARQESMASIPSVSSYGQTLNVERDDTFDYETLMRELDEVSGNIAGSTQALERSAARRRHHRLSTDSDRSSLHARGSRNHRREDLLTSFVPGAPPVSFHNRPYSRQLGHNQNLSIENGAAWGRHSSEHTDGTSSDDSAPYMSRPGLGDKMFQMGTEHGMPLPSIIASPANSDASEQQETFGDYANRRHSFVSDRRHSYISERRNSYAPSVTDQHRMSFVSYDSMLDGTRDGRRTSIDGDSMFERRGRPSSIGSISVFGDDNRRRRRSRAIYNPSQFRPVSIISIQSETTAEDDTMVSMIGGGDNRVPRKSIGTTLLLDTSPCMRAEKRARDSARARHIEANRAASLSALTGEPVRTQPQAGSSRDSILEYSPSKGRSCVPSRPFARPHPPASRPTIEDSDPEEVDLPSDRTPMPSMFARPLATHSRQSLTVESQDTSSSRKRGSLICTAEPPDTPPLSDASSVSGGSQSSIDVSKLAGMLENTSASGNAPPSGRRARARGQGHRRPASQTSRSSISEADLPRGGSLYLNRSNSNMDSSISDSVVIVDPDAQMAEMVDMISAGVRFSDEQMALITRYCALRNEAMETVARSQQIWQDTDFSRFALSTFTPPTHPAEIKALIDHSQDTYGELPEEFYQPARPRHSRSYPRSSPYPADVSRRSLKSSISPRARMATESVEHALALLPPMYDPISRSPRPLQGSPAVSHLVNPVPPSPAPSALAPLSPLVVNYRPPRVTEEKSLKPSLRPRAALGWGRRKPTDDAPANLVKGKGKAIQAVAPTAAKENEGVGLMSSSNQSLRLNRPRPKGRVASVSSRPTLRV